MQKIGGVGGDMHGAHKICCNQAPVTCKIKKKFCKVFQTTSETNHLAAKSFTILAKLFRLWLHVKLKKKFYQFLPHKYFPTCLTSREKISVAKTFFSNFCFRRGCM